MRPSMSWITSRAASPGAKRGSAPTARRTSIKYVPNFSFINNPIPKEKEKVAGRQGALIRTIARRSIRKRKGSKKGGREIVARMKESGRLVYGAAATGALRRGTAEEIKQDSNAARGVSQPGKPPTDRTGLLKRFIFFSWEESTQSVFIGPEKLAKDGEVPHLLEYGGMGRGFGPKGPKKARYRARPTMQLALAAGMQRLPELWKDVMRK